MSPSCEDCRFWDISTQIADEEADSTGLCRVLPPTADKRHNKTAVWPFTDFSDWCGAFAAKPLEQSGVVPR
jgi:hypothetical protein